MEGDNDHVMGFAVNGLDGESKREIDIKNVVTYHVSKKIIINS